MCLTFKPLTHTRSDEIESYTYECGLQRKELGASTKRFSGEIFKCGSPAPTRFLWQNATSQYSILVPHLICKCPYKAQAR